MTYRRSSTSLKALDLATLSRLHGSFPDRLYIEKRLLKGEYARNVARDLWFWLRRTLNDLRYQCDEERAAQLARQLAYLCQNYQTESLTDPYQGPKVTGNVPLTQ